MCRLSWHIALFLTKHEIMFLKLFFFGKQGAENTNKCLYHTLPSLTTSTTVDGTEFKII
jgi:hypothetical protein